ncbi:unnamed protein product [Amoebophrya sp. A25]|nr:unnamed protein product [Amoebophrya sp. A25]|eukprot:GSA25T00008059001.1
MDERASNEKNGAEDEMEIMAEGEDNQDELQPSEYFRRRLSEKIDPQGSLFADENATSNQIPSHLHGTPMIAGKKVEFGKGLGMMLVPVDPNTKDHECQYATTTAGPELQDNERQGSYIQAPSAILPTSLMAGLLQSKMAKGTLLQSMIGVLTQAVEWTDRLDRAYLLARQIEVARFQNEYDMYEAEKLDCEAALMLLRLLGKNLRAIERQHENDLKKMLLNEDAVDLLNFSSIREEALGDLLTSFDANYEKLRSIGILPKKVQMRLDVYHRLLQEDKQTCMSSLGLEAGPAFNYFLCSNKSCANLKDLSPELNEKEVLERMGKVMDRAAGMFEKVEEITSARFEIFRVDADWMKKAINQEKTINRKQATAKQQFVNGAACQAGNVIAFLGSLVTTQSHAAHRRQVLQLASASKLSHGLVALRNSASMEKSLLADANIQKLIGRLNNLALCAYRNIIVPYFEERLEIDIYPSFNTADAAAQAVASHRLAGFTSMDPANGLSEILKLVTAHYGKSVDNDLFVDNDFMSDDGGEPVDAENGDEDPDELQDMEEQFLHQVDDIKL